MVQTLSPRPYQRYAECDGNKVPSVHCNKLVRQITRCSSTSLLAYIRVASFELDLANIVIIFQFLLGFTWFAVPVAFGWGQRESEREALLAR